MCLGAAGFTIGHPSCHCLACCALLRSRPAPTANDSQRWTPRLLGTYFEDLGAASTYDAETVRLNPALGRIDRRRIKNHRKQTPTRDAPAKSQSNDAQELAAPMV